MLRLLGIISLGFLYFKKKKILKRFFKKYRSMQKIILQIILYIYILEKKEQNIN